MTHSLSVAGADKAAGDVAQRHVGDRRVEHFHERRDDDRERDEPRIDDRAAAIDASKRPPMMRRSSPGIAAALTAGAGDVSC